MVDHLLPAPVVLGDDGHAGGEGFQPRAGPVLARPAVDRQQAVEHREVLRRRDGHRLQDAGPHI